jgi:hypothetical protein
LAALKGMARKSLGKIMDEEWIQVCNNVKTTEDELMEEATENIPVL